MTGWIGQDQPIAAFLSALGGDRLHHGWLLAGPEGVGKGGIARDFAKALLSDLPPHDVQAFLAGWSAPAVRLVEAGTHPDLTVLQRLPRDRKADGGELARNISVDQVRELSRFLHLAPSMAARRVVIIDSIDDMERGAANALLKSLEEPPSGVVFLLISHSPGRLLPTIRSRCRTLLFAPLADSAVEQVLASASDLGAGQRQLLVEAAEGSPGRALAMRDLDLAELEARLVRIAETGDPDNVERVAMARMLSPKAAQARYEAMLAHAPRFLARRMRTTPARRRGQALAAWEEANAIVRGATQLSLDPATTIFSLCATVAKLADGRESRA